MGFSSDLVVLVLCWFSKSSEASSFSVLAPLLQKSLQGSFRLNSNKRSSSMLGSFSPDEHLMSNVVDLALSLEEKVKQISKETGKSRQVVVAAMYESVQKEGSIEPDNVKRYIAEPTRSPSRQLAPIDRVPAKIEHLNFLVRSKAIRSETFRPDIVYPKFSELSTLAERLQMFRDKVAEQRHVVQIEQIPIKDGEELICLVHGLGSYSAEQMKKSKFMISLIGQEAVDANGVFRSVITAAGHQLAADRLEIFRRTDNGFVYFNHDLDTSKTTNLEEYRSVIRAVGRMIGLVLINPENVTLPTPFAPAIFKILLGEELELNDLETFQPDVSRTIKETFFMDPQVIRELMISFPDDHKEFPSKQVDEYNRIAYLRFLVQKHLGLYLPLNELLLGVQDVCPLQPLCIFTPQMLQLVLCGQRDFQVQALIESAVVKVPPEAIEVVDWFWDCVKEMSPDDRSLLLIFVTGAVSEPADGFISLKPRFTVTIQSGSSKFPISKTCFNLIVLPTAKSKAELNENLLYAIRNTGTAQFGFA